MPLPTAPYECCGCCYRLRSTFGCRNWRTTKKIYGDRIAIRGIKDSLSRLATAHLKRATDRKLEWTNSYGLDCSSLCGRFASHTKYEQKRKQPPTMDYSHASNEPVGKPKYQNFQKRNSLISIATILEKSAECDFFYSPV